MLPVCAIHTIDHAACLPVSAWIDGDHPEGICPLVDFPLEKGIFLLFFVNGMCCSSSASAVCVLTLELVVRHSSTSLSL